MNCVICALKFMNMNDLIQHASSRQQNSEHSRFICISCSIPVNKISNVIEHIKSEEHSIMALATDIRFDAVDSNLTALFPPLDFCVLCSSRSSNPYEAHIGSETHRKVALAMRGIIKSKKIHVSYKEDQRVRNFLNKILNVKQKKTSASAKLLDTSPFFCELCNIYFGKLGYLTQHLKNQAHKRMVECMSKIVTTVEDCDIIGSVSSKTKLSETFSNSFRPLYHCESCCIWIETEISYKSHIIGSNHKRQLTRKLSNKRKRDAISQREDCSSRVNSYLRHHHESRCGVFAEAVAHSRFKKCKHNNRNVKVIEECEIVEPNCRRAKSGIGKYSNRKVPKILKASPSTLHSNLSLCENHSKGKKATGNILNREKVSSVIPEINTTSDQIRQEVGETNFETITDFSPLQFPWPMMPYLNVGPFMYALSPNQQPQLAWPNMPCLNNAPVNFNPMLPPQFALPSMPFFNNVSFNFNPIQPLQLALPNLPFINSAPLNSSFHQVQPSQIDISALQTSICLPPPQYIFQGSDINSNFPPYPGLENCNLPPSQLGIESCATNNKFQPLHVPESSKTNGSLPPSHLSLEANGTSSNLLPSQFDLEPCTKNSNLPSLELGLQVSETNNNNLTPKNNLQASKSNSNLTVSEISFEACANSKLLPQSSPKVRVTNGNLPSSQPGTEDSKTNRNLLPSQFGLAACTKNSNLPSLEHGLEAHATVNNLPPQNSPRASKSNSNIPPSKITLEACTNSKLPTQSRLKAISINSNLPSPHPGLEARETVNNLPPQNSRRASKSNSNLLPSETSLEACTNSKLPTKSGLKAIVINSNLPSPQPGLEAHETVNNRPPQNSRRSSKSNSNLLPSGTSLEACTNSKIPPQSCFEASVINSNLPSPQPGLEACARSSKHPPQSGFENSETDVGSLFPSDIEEGEIIDSSLRVLDDNETDDHSALQEHYCELCDFLSYSPLQYEKHLTGERHKKMRRLINKKEKKECFKTQVSSESCVSHPLQYNCELCDVFNFNFEQYEDHLECAKHKRNQWLLYVLMQKRLRI